MILDMLGSDLADAGRPVFTAASPPPDEVAVAGPVAPVSFINAQGNAWFARGDNPILNATWINIPFGFGFGTGTTRFQIVWEDSAANIIPVAELPDSWVQMPDPCAELLFPVNGLFLTFPQSAVGKAKLSLDGVAMNVSMINLPADLAGDVISPQWHIQVLHTKPLTLTSA